MNNQQLFETMQGVSKHQQLLKVNRALIRIIAIKRFILCYTGQIKEKVFNAPQTLVGLLQIPICNICL